MRTYQAWMSAFKCSYTATYGTILMDAAMQDVDTAFAEDRVARSDPGRLQPARVALSRAALYARTQHQVVYRATFGRERHQQRAGNVCVFHLTRSDMHMTGGALKCDIPIRRQCQACRMLIWTCAVFGRNTVTNHFLKLTSEVSASACVRSLRHAS